jgi:hypothetical protein
MSTSLRANLTHLIWAKMRAGDARHAAGTENFTLPDMGAYGGDTPGIFGICRMPAHERTAHLRGRTFFWGDDSTGLMKLITDRAATRQPYQLEPALAPLADLWAAITGNRPLPAGSRYDLATTTGGRTTTGTAGIRAKLAAVAGMLTSPAGPADPPGSQDSPQHPAGPGEDRRDALDTLRALVARPGGVSVREAAEALPWQPRPQRRGARRLPAVAGRPQPATPAHRHNRLTSPGVVRVLSAGVVRRAVLAAQQGSW